MVHRDLSEKLGVSLRRRSAISTSDAARTISTDYMVSGEPTLYLSETRARRAVTGRSRPGYGGRGRSFPSPMKILFDQGTPVPLQRHLTGNVVETLFERGWSCQFAGDSFGKHMKIWFCVMVAIFLSAGFGMAQCASRQDNLSAKICFERFESNGAINTQETVVKLSNYQSISLMGGQAACIFLEPGDHSFNIGSCKAYETPWKQWSSEKYPFRLIKGGTVSFEIYPTADGASYTGYFAARRLRTK